MSPLIFKPSPHCFFARFAMTPCDGHADRCHLIPKQRITKQFKSQFPDATRQQIQAAVWHPSVWQPGCRKHHSNFDAKMLRIERSDIPAETEVYARIMELTWSLEADYGPAEGAHG